MKSTKEALRNQDAAETRIIKYEIAKRPLKSGLLVSFNRSHTCFRAFESQKVDFAADFAYFVKIRSEKPLTNGI